MHVIRALQEARMNSTPVVVQGLVRPDGTLELKDKLSLSPGPVQVTIMPFQESPRDDLFWQMMQGIWADQKARGHVPRSAAEVEGERKKLRAEWEERMQEIQRVQEEARMIREPGTQGAATSAGSIARLSCRCEGTHRAFCRTYITSSRQPGQKCAPSRTACAPAPLPVCRSLRACG